MANKCKGTITLTGQKELLNQIDQLGGNIEKACEEAVLASGREATKQYKEFINDHKQTGLTESSLVDNPVIKRDGSKIILRTGFNVSKGGSPAIWLDRGTPKQKALKFVQKIKKSTAVTSAIENTLAKAWREL